MPFIWTDINSPFIVHSCISSNCAGHVIHFGEASAEKRDPGEYERYSRKMWQQEGCMKRLCWVPFRTNQLHNTQNCDNYVRRPHITEALRRLWLDNKYSSPASVEKFAQRLLKLTRRRRPEIVAQRWLSLTLHLQQASDRGLSIQSLFFTLKIEEEVWYIRKLPFFPTWSICVLISYMANQTMRTKSRWKSENQESQRSMSQRFSSLPVHSESWSQWSWTEKIELRRR